MVEGVDVATAAGVAAEGMVMLMAEEAVETAVAVAAAAAAEVVAAAAVAMAMAGTAAAGVASVEMAEAEVVGPEVAAAAKDVAKWTRALRASQTWTPPRPKTPIRRRPIGEIASHPG